MSTVSSDDFSHAGRSPQHSRSRSMQCSTTQGSLRTRRSGTRPGTPGTPGYALTRGQHGNNDNSSSNSSRRRPPLPQCLRGTREGIFTHPQGPRLRRGRPGLRRMGTRCLVGCHLVAAAVVAAAARLRVRRQRLRQRGSTRSEGICTRRTRSRSSLGSCPCTGSSGFLCSSYLGPFARNLLCSLGGGRSVRGRRGGGRALRPSSSPVVVIHHFDGGFLLFVGVFHRLNSRPRSLS